MHPIRAHDDRARVRAPVFATRHRAIVAELHPHHPLVHEEPVLAADVALEDAHQLGAGQHERLVAVAVDHDVAPLGAREGAGGDAVDGDGAVERLRRRPHVAVHAQLLEDAQPVGEQPDAGARVGRHRPVALQQHPRHVQPLQHQRQHQARHPAPHDYHLRVLLAAAAGRAAAGHREGPVRGDGFAFVVAGKKEEGRRKE